MRNMRRISETAAYTLTRFDTVNGIPMIEILDNHLPGFQHVHFTRAEAWELSLRLREFALHREKESDGDF